MDRCVTFSFQPVMHMTRIKGTIALPINHHSSDWDPAIVPAATDGTRPLSTTGTLRPLGQILLGELRSGLGSFLAGSRVVSRVFGDVARFRRKMPFTKHCLMNASLSQPLVSFFLFSACRAIVLWVRRSKIRSYARGCQLGKIWAIDGKSGLGSQCGDSPGGYPATW